MDTVTTLRSARIVRAWERGSTCPPSVRSLAVLAAALPHADPARLAALPLGTRDALLLGVHARTFGRTVRGLVRCPACDLPCDLSLDASALLAQVPVTPQSAGAFEREGLRVVFRQPDSHDLHAAECAPDVTSARRILLERCVTRIERNGVPIEPCHSAEETLTLVAEAIQSLDPLADILVAVRCPSCAHTWEAPLDVDRIVWAEIERHARRLLGEVHVLARAYGWSERDILRMGTKRRTAYLEGL